MNQSRFVLKSAAAILLLACAYAQDDNTITQDPVAPYPTYNTIPPGLSFTCQTRGAGYYADPETRCQVWHWCLPSGQKFSFLCPNGTVFNQSYRVCDWWFNVDCATAVEKYKVNDDLYRTLDGNLI